MIHKYRIEAGEGSNAIMPEVQAQKVYATVANQQAQRPERPQLQQTKLGKVTNYVYFQ